MLNNVNLIGRLTTTPDLQKTSSDKAYSRITLAVNRRFKNQNKEQETDFISIVFWGKTAETLVSYAKKGALVSVEGEVRAYSYEDKNKERHYVTEILGSNFSLLESRAAVALREGRESLEDTILEAEELPF